MVDDGRATVAGMASIDDLVLEHCGATLEVLYPVPCACGGQARVCRVLGPPQKAGRGASEAPKVKTVVLRIHSSIKGIEGEGEGDHGDGPGTSAEVGHGEDARRTKLWDFLEELRVGSAGGAGREPAAAASGVLGSREPIECLPMTDASVREALASHERGKRGSGAPRYYLHPNILTPLAFFRAPGGAVVSVYPNPGGQLSSVLKYSTRGFLNGATSALIVYQVAQLVRFCHGRGLALGSLSASNFFCSDQGLVRALVDYNKLRGVAGTGRDDGDDGHAGNQSDGAAGRLAEGFVAWRQGALSNFDYLMLLNWACGRERGNLAFYPVLPWVVDMTQDPREDAAEGGGWRDLTQTKWRLAKGDLQLDMTYVCSDPPHHVSDEALSELTVCVYLARRLRKEVLTDVVRAVFEPREYPSSMQRMFQWTPDEAIPDFYDNPEIFSSTHEGMDNLQAPHWSKSPQDFVKIHREALESPRVSEVLHRWIDLNFGAALLGEDAVANKNVHLPHKDTCFPRCRGRFQLFATAHPGRFPPPPRALSFGGCRDLEAADRFTATNLSFCERSYNARHQAPGRGDDSRHVDVAFVCRLASALFSPRRRDALLADAGLVTAISSSPPPGAEDEHLFPRSLRQYVRGLVSASPALTMDHVVLCPAFQAHVKDAYDLVAASSDPARALGDRLAAILDHTRSRLAGAADRGVHVVALRCLLDALHFPSGEVGEAREPSDREGRDLAGILEILLAKLPTDVTKDHLLPFLVGALQGSSTPASVLPGNRRLALALRGLLLDSHFCGRLLDLLGADCFFRNLYPKVIELVAQGGGSGSAALVSEVVTTMAARLPLPVTVKKVLDPLLNLLYYDPCFAGLVCDLSQRLGRTFVQTQVYPRLVEIAGRAVVAAGRSGRLRPTPQATDHLGSALALLTAVRGHVDPAVVMRTLVEDTWRGEVQQPGLLLQILLLPYPDLSVLCRTAALLVDGAISGGGRKYVLGTLIPNLEPIFFLGQDPADYYIAAVTFLHRRLCQAAGEEAVGEACAGWASIEAVRARDKLGVEEIASLDSLPSLGGDPDGAKSWASGYRWLCRSEGGPSLPFSPTMPEGIKVSPSSYVTSLDDGLGTDFRCVHQFKPSVSRVRFAVAEEMAGLVLAAGSASSSSSSPVIRAWDFGEDRVERIYVGHGSSVTGLASLRGGKVVASCEAGGKLRVWEPKTDAEACYGLGDGGAGEQGGGQDVGCTCLAAHGDLVALGREDGSLTTFDADAQRPLGLWRACQGQDQGSIQAMAAHSAGGLLACGFSAGSASLLDLRSGRIVRSFDATRGGGAVRCLSFAGENLVCAGGRDSVRVYDRRKLSEATMAATSCKGGSPTGVYPAGRQVLVSWGPRLQVLDPTCSDAVEAAGRPFKLRNLGGAKESSNISGVSVLGLSQCVVVGNESSILFYSLS